LRDLLNEPAPAFVHKLYRQIVGRPPDEYETSYHLHRILIGGVAKEAVLRDLVRSEHERFVTTAYRDWKRREPSPEELAEGVATLQTGLLGRIVLLRGLGKPSPEWDAILPATPDVSAALTLDGEAFVRAAWQAVAGRPPSAAELVSASVRLHCGAVTRAGLLQEIGLPASGRDRWFKLPVIGHLLHVLALIWNLPAIERELSALRHRYADLGIRQRILELRFGSSLDDVFRD
jgi:hypothetical protein